MDELKKYLQEHRAALDQDEPRAQVWDAIQTASAAQQKTEKDEAVIQPKQAKVVPFRKILTWAAAACVLVLAGIGLWDLTLPGSRESLQEKVSLPALLDSNVQPKEEGLATGNKAASENQAAKTDGLNNAPSNISRSNLPATVLAQAPGTLQTTAKTTGTRPQQMDPVNPEITTAKPEMVAAQAYINQIEVGFAAMIAVQKARVNTTPMYAENAAYFRDFQVELSNLEKDEKQLKKEIQQKGLRNQQLDALINIYQQKLTILKQLQLEMNKTNNRFKQQCGPVDTSRSYFISI